MFWEVENSCKALDQTEKKKKEKLERRMVSRQKRTYCLAFFTWIPSDLAKNLYVTYTQSFYSIYVQRTFVFFFLLACFLEKQQCLEIPYNRSFEENIVQPNFWLFFKKNRVAWNIISKRVQYCYYNNETWINTKVITNTDLFEKQ